MKSKKYKVVAKIGDDKFVKYNVNNLILFTEFLDKKFSDWRWFNVFEYTKDSSGSQIGNFTKNKRPQKTYI
jgi:hypothetical protein